MLGALYDRELANGKRIVVYRMMFTDRLCVGYGEDTYDRAWCYPHGNRAVEVAGLWDGEGDPPKGWVKEVGTERRRVNGDPELEYDARYELAPVKTLEGEVPRRPM